MGYDRVVEQRTNLRFFSLKAFATTTGLFGLGAHNRRRFLMSRNFELLTQIDREGEILSQLSPEGAPIRVPARTDGLPAQYEPLISFVQRVFLGIDMGAPRMVVFT